MQGLQQRYAELQALGAEVIFVGPETGENALQSMEKGHATIPVLADTSGEVMAAYGLRYTLPEYVQGGYRRMGFPEMNTATGYDLPVPATYVIASDGRIAAAYIEADYTHRMEPAAVVAAVRALATA